MDKLIADETVEYATTGEVEPQLTKLQKFLLRQDGKLRVQYHASGRKSWQRMCREWSHLWLQH